MRTFTFISFLILFFFSYNAAKATHAMGSDIEYRCKGNGKYTVYLKVYRDCNGIPMFDSPIKLSCSTTTFSVNNHTKISVRDITKLNPTCPQDSRCAGGAFPYGIEEHIWTYEIDLSSYSCCEWIISWEQCCRNSTITTGSADQHYFTTAMLNKCVTPCNNSPSFLINPTPVAMLCYNQDVNFNNLAVDTIDVGDSISYSLVSGLTSATSSINYLGSFNPLRPLTFSGFPNHNQAYPGGFHLNPITGDLRFRPIRLNEVAVMTVEAKEWRNINGTMEVIGIIRRDIEVIVTGCSGSIKPILQVPPDQVVCIGDEFCYQITATEANIYDSVFLSLSSNLPPGATYREITSLPRLKVAEICWTPTINDVSTIPYLFTFSAVDNACPIAGSTIKSFTLKVLHQGSYAQSNLIIDDLGCGTVAIDHTTQTTYPGYTFNYLIKDSLGNQLMDIRNKQDTFNLSSGKYFVELWTSSDLTCLNIIKDSIVISNTYIGSDTSRLSVCEDEMVTLSTNYQLNGNPTLFDWFEVNSNGNLLIASSSNQIQFTPTATKHYVAFATSGTCSVYDSTLVIWNPNPVAQITTSADSVCDRDARVEFQNTSQVSQDTISTQLWRFGNGDSSLQANPTHVYTSSGNYTVSLFVATNSGCVDSTYHTISVNENPTLSTVQAQNDIYLDSIAVFFVDSLLVPANYQWQIDTGQGFVSLMDSGQYSGVNTPMLIIDSITMNNDNHLFRCVVSVLNCYDTSNAAVLTVKQPPVGISMKGQIDVLKVYPNPAKTSITIENIKDSKPRQLSIVNAQGSTILKFQLVDRIQDVDISNLAPGVYYIHDLESNKKLSFVKE